jgi:hypothetical protein
MCYLQRSTGTFKEVPVPYHIIKNGGGGLMNYYNNIFYLAGYPAVFSIRYRYPAGYPASQIRYPAGYRI